MSSLLRRVTGARRGDSRQDRRLAFFDEAGAHTSYVAVEAAGLTFVVATDDSSVARRMFGSGQRSEFKVLERACARLPCDGVFVDVGANIGTASLPALQFFERVIALEPEPRNAALLRANAALNGLNGRVDVNEVACSARGGEVELRLAEGKHGTHAVKRPKEGTTSIVVRSVTLDELISASGLTPAEIGLVWMDVEGHEAQALQGAKKLIDARVPLVVEIRARTAAAVLDVVGAAYSSLVDLRAEVELKATELPAYLADLRERSGRSFTDVLFLDDD